MFSQNHNDSSSRLYEDDSMRHHDSARIHSMRHVDSTRTTQRDDESTRMTRRGKVIRRDYSMSHSQRCTSICFNPKGYSNQGCLWADICFSNWVHDVFFLNFNHFKCSIINDMIMVFNPIYSAFWLFYSSIHCSYYYRHISFHLV